MSDQSYGSLPSLSATLTPAPAPSQQGQISAANQGVQKAAAATASQAAPVAAQGMVDTSQIPDLETTAANAQGRYGSILDAAMQRVGQAKDTIDDANTKILAARGSPIISAFSALFGDTDSNIHYQKQRIQNEAEDLQNVNQQVSTLAAASQNADAALTRARTGAQFGINAAETATRAGTEAINAATSLASNARADVEARANLAIHARQEAIQQTEGLSDVDLQSAIQNPDLIAKRNPLITPGLLQSVSQSRQQTRTQLAQAAVVLSNTQMTNTEEGMNLANNLMANGIAHLSTSDWEQYSAQAAKNGSATIPVVLGDGSVKQVNVPAAMFTSVAYARQNAAAQNAKDTAAITEAQISNPIQAQALSNSYDNLVADPNTANTIGKDDLQGILMKAKVADALSQSNAPKDLLSRQATLASANKQIQDLVQASIAQKPEAMRPALTQYHQTAGQIPDPMSAQQYLQSSIEQSSQTPLSLIDGSPLGINDPYRDADVLLRNQYMAKLAKYQSPMAGLASGQATGASILGSISKQMPSKDEIFQQTLAAPEGGVAAKLSVINNLRGAAVYNAVKQLATDYKDQPGIQQFKDILPNGMVAAPYVTQKADGTKEIDVAKLFQTIANSDLQNNTQNMGLLVGKLNSQDFRTQFMGSLAKNYRTPEHAAYNRMLFKGNAEPYVFGTLANDANTILGAKTQQVAANNRQIVANLAQAGISANPDGTIPYNTGPFMDPASRAAIINAAAPKTPNMQPYSGAGQGSIQNLVKFFQGGQGQQ